MAIDIGQLPEYVPDPLCRRVAEVEFTVLFAALLTSVFKLGAANTCEMAAGVLVDDLMLLRTELPAAGLLGMGCRYGAPLLDYGPDDVKVDFAI